MCNSYFVNIGNQEVILKGYIIYSNESNYIVLEDNGEIDEKILNDIVNRVSKKVKDHQQLYQEKNIHILMDITKKEIERLQKNHLKYNVNYTELKNNIIFISTENMVPIRLLSLEEFNRFKKIKEIISEITLEK